MLTSIRAQLIFPVYWLLLVSLSLSNLLLAQEPLEKTKFFRIDANKGLSNSRVTCLLQDSEGFLWVGTEDGLNKYDAYNFRAYRHHPGDTASLLKSNIEYLYEDSHHTLWVSTASGGLHYYDRPRDRFVRIAAYAYNCEISQILEDKTHRLWIAGIKAKRAFAAYWNPTRRKWQEYILFQSAQPISFLSPDSLGGFWVGVNKTGFFHWNWQTNALITYSANSKKPHHVISNDFHKAIRDDKGDFWLATGEGLSQFHAATGQFTNYTAHRERPPQSGLLVNNVLNLCQDGPYIWVGTENGGLSRLDTRTQQFTHFMTDKNDPTSVSDNSIWALYKDHQQRLWVGTYSNGLCVIDHLQHKFAELDLLLTNDVVNAIYQDHKNRLWIGTEGGIAMKEGKQVRYYQHRPDQSGSLSSNPVLAIMEDYQHRMWFGTWEGGVNRYEEKRDRFITYRPNSRRPNSLSNPYVFSVLESATGQLLVGTYGGLNLLTDEKTGRFTTYTDPAFEANNYLRILYQDRKGILWIGTIEELAYFDKQSQRIVKWAKPNDPNRITGGVNCIVEDQQARLWVGTNNGLYLVVNQEAKAHYTILDGLPNDAIKGILEDGKGNLWLSTNHGICRFDPQKKTFTNYDVSDGLLSNKFNPNACFKNQNGQLFFGGKGINVFYPDSIQVNPYVPPVLLADLKLFNRSVLVGGKDGLLDRQLSQTQEIFLGPEYNFFTLEYVALNFTSSNKNQYAYRLEGFHPNWVHVGNQRSATFTNLDAGTYTFRVKACNNDGIWNEQGASLIIHILPPWWKSWWFRLVVGFAVLLLMVSGYQLRVSSIKKQNQKLEKLVGERTQALQSANQDLNAREEEINSQNEELSLQNEHLQNARKTIEEQNIEILLHNRSLDQEVKERTQELVEYNQQLEQFAFIAAHNLRAPVARILGLGEILKLPKKSLDEDAMLIEKLILTTQELDQVVRDVSTILQVRKSHALTITRIHLTEEVDAMKAILQTEIHTTQTSIHTNFSQVDCIHTVKPYLDSILLNLIHNAIKYRHPDRSPVIQLQAERCGEYVCLLITDNGLGIDLAQHQNHLFTLYKRFHLHVEGKGMGLYLVKTQVVALGGKIEVESTLEVGTTFKVFLKDHPTESIP